MLRDAGPRDPRPRSGPATAGTGQAAQGPGAAPLHQEGSCNGSRSRARAAERTSLGPPRLPPQPTLLPLPRGPSRLQQPALSGARPRPHPPTRHPSGPTRLRGSGPPPCTRRPEPLLGNPPHVHGVLAQERRAPPPPAPLPPAVARPSPPAVKESMWRSTPCWTPQNVCIYSPPILS